MLQHKWEELVAVYNQMCTVGTPRPSAAPMHALLNTGAEDLGDR